MWSTRWATFAQSMQTLHMHAFRKLNYSVCSFRLASTLLTTLKFVWVEMECSSCSAIQREPWSRAALQRWSLSTSCVMPGWQQIGWSLGQTRVGCWSLSLAVWGERSVWLQKLTKNSLTSETLNLRAMLIYYLYIHQKQTKSGGDRDGENGLWRIFRLAVRLK